MNAQTIQVIIAVLAVIMPPIIGGVVVLYQQKVAQLPQAQRAQLENIGHIVVTAVEQGAAQIPGPEKKAMAVAQLQNMAKQLGMKVDDQSASSFVEAAVFELNQGRQIAKQAWINTPNQSAPIIPS